MSTHLNLQIEVVGCPTVCMHCWAQGAPYQAMPVDDIRWVLEQARSFCADAKFTFSSFPMHEVAAHPQAVQVLQLFQELAAAEGENLFEPFTTTGVPLAVREDWREILSTLKSLGTTVVFLALHGVDDIHDNAVNRAGACQETLLAAERVLEMGLNVGCNIFLSKENLKQFDALVEATQRMGASETSWEIASYYPTPRGRRYEQSRPELHELLPMAEQLTQLSGFWKDRWANLQNYTEATYFKRAGENGRNGLECSDRSGLKLVCRNNLDVYVGDAKLYRQRLGNLRADGAEKVFKSGVEQGVVSGDALFFARGTVPSVYELARDVGEPRGQKIYFHPESMRYRWLDIALSQA